MALMNQQEWSTLKSSLSQVGSADSALWAGDDYEYQVRPTGSPEFVSVEIRPRTPMDRPRVAPPSARPFWIAAWAVALAVLAWAAIGYLDDLTYLVEAWYSSYSMGPFQR